MGEREENKRKSTDFRRPNVGFWQFWDWAQPATKNGITNKQPNVTQSCGYSTAKVGIQPTIGIHGDLSNEWWAYQVISSNFCGYSALSSATMGVEDSCTTRCKQKLHVSKTYCKHGFPILNCLITTWSSCDHNILSRSRRSKIVYGKGLMYINPNIPKPSTANSSRNGPYHKPCPIEGLLYSNES